jgi:hypothetical protein
MKIRGGLLDISWEGERGRSYQKINTKNEESNS